jgi:hypothetical protein
VTSMIPEGAVVRVSRGCFDPARLTEVLAMTAATGEYLVPAIKALPGLINYYVGASLDGSLVHVSIWASEGHAQQMGRLQQMVVDARADATVAGVEFVPIVNYPIGWSI